MTLSHSDPSSLSPAEKANQIAALERLMALVRAMPERRDCRECGAFNEGGRCNIWGEVVPEDVRSEGCEHWNAEVPF